ncbi:sugar ABC transporter ATP-binding protein [Streptomyces sp. NPDC001177]
MNPPLLELDRLSRSYPGVNAVSNVSLTLREGEIVGLAGKNGAGKSTLIKILAGAVSPTGGRILLDGRAVCLPTTATATRLGIAVVHQELADVPELSVAENVAMGLGYPRRLRVFVDRDKLRALAAGQLAALDASDIDPRARVGDLTPANQRLVTIARALLTRRARIIILDEPTAELTRAETDQLHRILRRLRDEGLCVLLVSHRLEEMLSLTDRIIVMRDGIVAGERPTADLDRSELIEMITGAVSEGDAEWRRHRRVLSRTVPGRTVLSVHGLTRRPAVHEVTLEVRSGEILGIAGLAGAGRTELVRLLAGADRAHSGTVALNGRPLRLRNPRSALSDGIVLLPENRRTQGAILDFSIRHNVTLASLSLHRLLPRILVPNPVSERRSAQHALTSLGIAAVNDEQRVGTLSGGNQQKVVIAKGTQREKAVLLFDEPTHGVDVEGKEEIYRLMESFADKGAAVVFVSSEFSELVGACHRVLVMRNGRLVAELAGRAVTEHALVHHAYGTTPAGSGS